MKHQKIIKGGIVKIPLENNFHTYGRILECDIAFYDSRTQKELSVEEIIKKSVLFSTAVYDYVIKEGYWLIIGKKPLEPFMLEFEQKPVYTEDIFLNKCIIHYRGGEQKIVNREEVQGLESCTVWTHTSIEKRLNDFYAGRLNWQVENIKIGRPMTGPLEAEWLKVNSQTQK